LQEIIPQNQNDLNIQKIMKMLVSWMLELAWWMLELACCIMELAWWMLELACWMLELACFMLELACWILELECWMLELACWSMESVDDDESLVFPSPDWTLLNFEKSIQNKQLNKPINIKFDQLVMHTIFQLPHILQRCSN
jgi:hypothetical protein